ncbi:hypothetical protein B6A10_07630 [Flavobacterium sp. L1I52]|uniref:Uncharacterized protein n=1 Tax=Flavobacterium pokkalii TaxID=1940408 RepID=A0ABR7USX9_9FLAO|nr:hypothetical protein [Flavobacterium pokkalii]MBD0725044.1 hypothetical protein [Flavobacterium pokkalii]
MVQDIKIASLRENTLASIAEFLLDENFQNSTILKEGILELINLLADYYEEGTHLFPQVLITNNSTEFFKTISNREILISNQSLSVSEFKNIIKLCAPLTVGSWIIYIEVNDNKLKYGLVDAEMTETSPSIYEQTVGELKVDPKDINIAFLRNIGSKTVELTGLKKKLIVSLTLDKIEISDNVILQISKEITKSLDQEYQIPIMTFIDKTIQDAVKQGHGNLIGVVKDDETIISKLKDSLSDGVYLNTPIDIADYIIYTEKEKTNESSISLMAFSKVMISMLNHDGITLLTDKGRILGYHIFIKSIEINGIQLVGGARTRAFQSMVNLDMFSACLYKSQDGNSKIWIK